MITYFQWRNYFDNHTHSHATTVVVNTGIATNTENCIGCHDTASAGNGPFTGSVHSVSTCSTCHDATGTLQGSAATADINGIATDAAYECAECHAGYFSNHQIHTPTVHAVSMGTDTSNGFSCNTSGCHGTFTNTWDGGNGIYALHTSDCTLCHDSGRNNGDGNVQNQDRIAV